MSSRFDIIAQLIFKKPLADCSIAELEGLTQQYPAFGAAHFLRAKAEQQSSVLNSKTYFQKAALYHHQPALFDAFLADEDVRFEPFPAPIISVEPVDTESALETNEVSDWNQEQDFDPEELLADPKDEENVPVPSKPDETEDPVVDDNDEEEVVESQTEDHEQPAQAIIVAENTAAIEESAPDPQPAAELQTEEATPVTQPVSHPTGNSEPLAFEPFHTVDYFASQGIRLSQSELPKDKFGKQVMSFTAWLKTMKKLPASEQIKNLDPQQEQKVEHLAAHSIEGDEVVTETMAEVWIKQGANQKAAEVYRKLSLLHPSKRAYFAAKIQQLK